jgi:hypothetical protein
VLGVGAGEFTLTAQDSDSGLTTTATSNLLDVTAPMTLDLTLPASGTVTGTVFDSTGNAIPFAEVYLVSASLNYERYAQANEAGVFRFERAALGGFALQARGSNGSGFPGGSLGVASGNVAGDGEAVTVNITMPATGTVRGTVFEADGRTPVANAEVRIENLDTAGPFGYFSGNITADEAGTFEAIGVPVGAIRIYAYGNSNRTTSGVAPGMLTADAIATINVTLGNGYSFYNGNFNLDGADGFRYDIENYGSISDGGNVQRTLTDAYDGGAYLIVNNRYYDYTDTAILEDQNREIVSASRKSAR